MSKYNNLPYLFNYTIGSMWGSGHGKKDTYTFRCNRPIDHIVAITLKIKDKFNFDFHEIAADYGDSYLKEDIVEIFKTIGINQYFEGEDNSDSYEAYLDQEALLYYWEQLLLKIDPTVILERITLDDVSYKIGKSSGYGLYD